MNASQRGLVVFVLIASVLMSGCGAGQVFGPTVTATATATMVPTITPTATLVPTVTMTPTMTATALPPALTDGTQVWPLIGVSFTDTTKIEGYEKPAADGMAYLVVEFQNVDQGIPSFPGVKGSNKVDYSQIYVTDSSGNKYIGVNNGVKMVPIAGSSGFHLGDFAIFFGPMPKDTHGFQLFFTDFPVVDLGQ